MRFEENSCTWAYIIKREILGPFASHSGWIWNQRKKESGSNQLTLLDKTFARSHIGKAVKRVEVAQQQQLVDAYRRQTLKPQISKFDIARAKLDKGLLYHILDGSRVREAGTG